MSADRRRPDRPIGDRPNRPRLAPRLARIAVAALILGAALGAAATARAQAAPDATGAAGGGFAGLGAGADGFAEVRPGAALVFPRDHGPHPRFRIEWWYVTANLVAPDGAAYGVQWTLFRQALAPGGAGAGGWTEPQLWMGHAAATSAEAHRFAQKLARGGVGVAGARAAPFAAWIDDWSLESLGEAFSPLRMTASGDGFAFDLTLRAEGPMTLHGQGGYSAKSDRGQASYYVSQPFLEAEGALTIDGRRTEVSGRAWMDREWSSRPLAADQTGWDWFSLHLDDGAKVMLFGLRDAGGGRFRAGTWIDADGRATPLASEEIEMTPDGPPEPVAAADGRRLPLRWTLAVPGRGLKIRVAPLNPESWMGTRFPYWEGPVRFSGTHSGVGYLEMTGY